MILVTLHNFLCAGLEKATRTKLTSFPELAPTFIRLRLNLNVVDLAYRFKISSSTVSAVYAKWLDTMFIKMQPLIMWPDRAQLQETTPVSFRKYFGTKVAVIIDCFEVFIKKPMNLRARASTWSNYKHHNTVKFLIGIAPQGIISFISKALGGRMSDKHLTEIVAC